MLAFDGNLKVELLSLKTNTHVLMTLILLAQFLRIFKMYVKKEKLYSLAIPIRATAV